MFLILSELNMVRGYKLKDVTTYFQSGEFISNIWRVFHKGVNSRKIENDSHLIRIE